MFNAVVYVDYYTTQQNTDCYSTQKKDNFFHGLFLFVVIAQQNPDLGLAKSGLQCDMSLPAFYAADFVTAGSMPLILARAMMLMSSSRSVSVKPMASLEEDSSTAR